MLTRPRYSFLALLLTIPLLVIGPSINFNNENEDSSPAPTNTPLRAANTATSLEQYGNAPASSFLLQSTSNPEPTGTPTITPIATNSTPVIRLALRINPVIYAFINAPAEPVPEPYVILSAYRSVANINPLQITGRINNIGFICPGMPCRLAVTPNAKIIFQAQGPSGETSAQVQATVRVERHEDGFLVSLEQISQFFAYRDACASMWNILPGDSPKWDSLPQQPEELATSKTLHYLSGSLIRSGIVNAEDCPGKGFDSGGAPNRCGLDRARSAMIEWQNLFDFDIWLTAKDLQIPPQVLKVLIEIESQFWPANVRTYFDEIGLGQISQSGIDVLIRQDPSLYYMVCASVLGNCNTPYSTLPEELQAMIRGALLNSLNAYCETCPNKIDISVAKQSVSIIGLLLRANCNQVDRVMELYEVKASVEDHWKFTLVSYHSGLSCVENAIEKLADQGETIMDWNHVSRKITCPGAVDYVEMFWRSLTTFDTFRLKPKDAPPIPFAATFLPTPTPIPTIGPPPSKTVVWVIIILDENHNGIPEESEWINGIVANLRFPNGTELSSVTTNGKAVFDMDGYTSGTRVIVTLPGLYRTTAFNLPEKGILPIVFVFLQPLIPPALP